MAIAYGATPLDLKAFKEKRPISTELATARSVDPVTAWKRRILERAEIVTTRMCAAMRQLCAEYEIKYSITITRAGKDKLGSVTCGVVNSHLDRLKSKGFVPNWFNKVAVEVQGEDEGEEEDEVEGGEAETEDAVVVEGSTKKRKHSTSKTLTPKTGKHSSSKVARKSGSKKSSKKSSKTVVKVSSSSSKAKGSFKKLQFGIPRAKVQQKLGFKKKEVVDVDMSDGDSSDGDSSCSSSSSSSSSSGSSVDDTPLSEL